MNELAQEVSKATAYVAAGVHIGIEYTGVLAYQPVPVMDNSPEWVGKASQLSDITLALAMACVVAWICLYEFEQRLKND